MQALLEVILPVFLVIGGGYVAVWRLSFPDAGIDGLMKYTQNYAIPCLLFRAMWQLDLEVDFNPSVLLSFYSGSGTCFVIGLLGARFGFRRGWEDSIAIAFVCLFANSVLLGLPITERAYGVDALTTNFTIVAMHSPFAYGIGITAMEIARAQGGNFRTVSLRVLKAMFSNALILAILLGLSFNLLGIGLPAPVQEALSMMALTALPVALFAVGGVLRRYRPEGDLRLIAMVCTISLVLHPVIAWTMGRTTGISDESFRSVVLTASMAPGINGYVFANMYGRARRVAAASVLIATALSILTIWVWLQLIP